jgi:hypothetical protein
MPSRTFNGVDVANPPTASMTALLLEYLELIGAEKGAVVYMTYGDVRWVHHDPGANAKLPEQRL